MHKFYLNVYLQNKNASSLIFFAKSTILYAHVNSLNLLSLQSQINGG